MKKMIKGLAMVAAGLLVIEVIKHTVVYPATELFDEGLENLMKKSSQK